MQATSLSSFSGCGKFVANDKNGETLQAISLKQHFAHERPFQLCRFDTAGNKIFLLDSAGELICVSLLDSSFSTLRGQQISSFTIDGSNSFNLLTVNRKSELSKVGFQSKNSSKLMNLNLSKILAFERNYLRETILVLDYKLLFLCDLPNCSRTRSLKAGSYQTFTNACFASQNRFIVLAVKGIEIRILQVFNLRLLHTITLPFEVRGLKIEVSFDCKTIAIYGDCKVVFFISIDEQSGLSYQLVEFEFLKSVKQLTFSYEGYILILGSDQKIYAISPENYNRIFPIFNDEQKIRLMAFDISLDSCRLAVVSNRTVFTLDWKNGIKGAIAVAQNFRNIEFSKQPANVQRQAGQEKYQYEGSEEEDEDYQDQKLKLQARHKRSNPSNESKPIRRQLMQCGSCILPNLPEIRDLLDQPFQQQVQQLQLASQKKCHVQQIFKYLFENLHDNQLLTTYRPNAVRLISVVLQLADDPYKALDVSFTLLGLISSACKSDCIEKCSLILAPEIVQQVEGKRGINFYEFFSHQMTVLFSQFIPSRKRIDILNSIIQNRRKQEFIVVLFVQVLKLLQKQDQNWPTNRTIFNNVDEAIASATQIVNLKKYDYVFARPNQFQGLIKSIGQPKGSVVQKSLCEGDADTLQELFIRQEQLRKALAEANLE